MLPRACYALPALLAALACGRGGQQPDSDYDTRIAAPAYRMQHPVVRVDDAHHNRHSSRTGYAPFASLAEHDGYVVRRNADSFDHIDPHTRILVVVNASSASESQDVSAFSASEVASVRAWVVSGGSLLLVVDHFPYGGAASELAGALGATIGRGMVLDSAHCDSSAAMRDESQLVFSDRNGLLGVHPILRGRDAGERIHRVVTFTGSWVSGPAGATALLQLSADAIHVEPSVRVEQRGSDRLVHVDYAGPSAAGSHTQGTAFTLGRGRVVVMAEAAALTAQRNRDGTRFGMNLPGNDNRQFTLNILHWLSGVL